MKRPLQVPNPRTRTPSDERIPVGTWDRLMSFIVHPSIRFLVIARLSVLSRMNHGQAKASRAPRDSNVQQRAQWPNEAAWCSYENLQQATKPSRFRQQAILAKYQARHAVVQGEPYALRYLPIGPPDVIAGDLWQAKKTEPNSELHQSAPICRRMSRHTMNKPDGLRRRIDWLAELEAWAVRRRDFA